MKMQVRINRAEAVRNGIDVPSQYVELDVDPSQLAEADRVLLSDRLYADSGTLEVRQLHAGGLITVSAPTVEALVAAVRRDEEKRRQAEAKAKAHQEREAAKAREDTAAVLRDRKTKSKIEDVSVRVAGDQILPCKSWEKDGYQPYTVLSPDWPYRYDTGVTESDEAQAWAAELQAQNEAAQARALEIATTNLRDRLASEAKAKAERTTWIDAHGSDRLKRLIAEGIEHDSVYLDERLTMERPGWRWERQTPGDSEAPRNCPAEAFALLDEARKTDPDAELTWWVMEHTCDDDCGYCGEEYEWKGYACLARFLGREIVYGVPVEYRL